MPWLILDPHVWYKAYRGLLLFCSLHILSPSASDIGAGFADVKLPVSSYRSSEVGMRHHTDDKEGQSAMLWCTAAGELRPRGGGGGDGAPGGVQGGGGRGL